MDQTRQQKSRKSLEARAVSAVRTQLKTDPDIVAVATHMEVELDEYVDLVLEYMAGPRPIPSLRQRTTISATEDRSEEILGWLRELLQGSLSIAELGPQLKTRGRLTGLEVHHKAPKLRKDQGTVIVADGKNKSSLEREFLRQRLGPQRNRSRGRH